MDGVFVRERGFVLFDALIFAHPRSSGHNQLEVTMMSEQKIEPVELTDDELSLVAGGLTLTGASGANANAIVNAASANPGQAFVAFGAIVAVSGAGGGFFQ